MGLNVCMFVEYPESLMVRSMILLPSTCLVANKSDQLFDAACMLLVHSCNDRRSNSVMELAQHPVVFA